jgi:hypothetical protein
MNVVFGRFNVNKGVRVYIADTKSSAYLGAFSDLNIKPNGIFSTGILYTDIILIEVHVPDTLKAPVRYRFREWGAAGHGLKSTGLKDGWYGSSGECNADIKCHDQYPYNNSKNSL